MDGGHAVLEVDGLTRRYGPRVVVDDLTFDARAGEVLGLLGPNGAGKTTTLRMLAGLLTPTRGGVRLFGRELSDASRAARQPLAYLPEHASPYEEMTVWAYLLFLARLWGAPRRQARDAVDESLARLDLTDVRRRVIGTLSRGYRQRVAIAGAIVHDPQVVLLDEPTTGLDPRQVVDFRTLVSELARDRLVVLSTHLLAEASQLCDRVLVLHKGRQVALDAPDALAAAAGRGRVHVVVRGPGDEVRRRLDALPRVEVVDSEAHGAEVRLTLRAEGDERAAISHEVVGRGWDLLELGTSSGLLEDVFLELTQ